MQLDPVYIYIFLYSLQGGIVGCLCEATDSEVLQEYMI